MLKAKDNNLFYTLLLSYVVINIIGFTQEFYWTTLIPVLVIGIWLLFYSTEKIILFVALATPLSFKYNFEDLGVSINLPTEPILIILLVLYLFKLLLSGKIDKAFFTHPLSLAILINLGWMFITALSSSMFFVSIKAVIARMWFVCVFYIMAYEVFKSRKNIVYFVYLSIISLTIVILYSLRRHYINDWWQLYANYAPHPYFAGHGDYAAAISLFIPFLFLFILKYKMMGIKNYIRWGFVLLLGLFLFGTVMSYTRAAWLGLAAAFGLYIIYLFKIKWYVIVLTLVVGGGLFLAFEDDIMLQLKSNKEVSADNFEQHIESISNISTDASNTERINRWMSAWRMFKERPILGWGPGTYMFQYAPFQVSHEMTIISTNAGNLGNAHSEYIGPLSESGILGFFSVIAMVIFSIVTSFRIIYNPNDDFIKFTAMAAILGLVTYFTHGVINNYLDTDKAAVPVFALMSMLTCLDLYHNKKPQTDN